MSLLLPTARHGWLTACSSSTSLGSGWFMSLNKADIEPHTWYLGFMCRLWTGSVHDLDTWLFKKGSRLACSMRLCAILDDHNVASKARSCPEWQMIPPNLNVVAAGHQPPSTHAQPPPMMHATPHHFWGTTISMNWLYTRVNTLPPPPPLPYLRRAWTRPSPWYKERWYSSLIIQYLRYMRSNLSCTRPHYLWLRLWPDINHWFIAGRRDRSARNFLMILLAVIDPQNHRGAQMKLLALTIGSQWWSLLDTIVLLRPPCLLWCSNFLVAMKDCHTCASYPPS